MDKSLFYAAIGCFITAGIIAALGIQKASEISHPEPVQHYNKVVSVKPDYLACIDEVSAIKARQQDRVFHLLESSRCMPTADLPAHDATVIFRQGSIALVNVNMPDDESARLWVSAEAIETKKPE